ncbi:hypothetical protein Lser_V15G20149 [Lactuca serriola]
MTGGSGSCPPTHLSSPPPLPTYAPPVNGSMPASPSLQQVAYPGKIAIGGHSYGAFMTANLLAHSPHLFSCSIARSGAYNRTLTPFGFQMRIEPSGKPLILTSRRVLSCLLIRLRSPSYLSMDSHGYSSRESIMRVLWETIHGLLPEQAVILINLTSRLSIPSEKSPRVYQVSEALFEITLPRFSGDILPETDAGTVLSIADRLDSLVGLFGAGCQPSSTNDPFGLQRISYGLVLVEIDRNLDLQHALEVIASVQSLKIDVVTIREVIELLLGAILSFMTTSAGVAIADVTIGLCDREQHKPSFSCWRYAEFVWFSFSIGQLVGFSMSGLLEKSSGAKGERLKEATNINKSLSTLG